MTTNVEVLLTPPAQAAGSHLAGKTVIVVDTLRATTVITTLIAGGAAAVYPCESVEEARRLAASITGSQLCGEEGGLPPEGFHFGNSPTEFAALAKHNGLQGWTVVQATSNGTRALRAAAGADQTLVGCLRNRSAVAKAVLDDAGDSGREIVIVCSGDGGGSAPSVEDTFTAGAIVEELAALTTGRRTGRFVVRDGARLARRVFQAYGGSAQVAFADSSHAEGLRKLGFERDLAFAAMMDVEDAVPRASMDAVGRMVILG